MRLATSAFPSPRLPLRLDSATVTSSHYDLILVGGGLSAGLIALALRQKRPEIRLAIIDSGESFGGNHTWSSFATDLTREGHALVAPLIAHRWTENQIRFPAISRKFDVGYQSATSDRLHEALVAALPADSRFLSAPVVATTPSSVTLADQRTLTANAVIEARGQKISDNLELGFQKFVGLEVEFAAPHGLKGPIIMDATVDQHDGYRFVYVLPFTPTTALIEDTYYADGPALDRAAVAARVHAYAVAQGWQILRTIREEDGVLPIAIDGDIEAHLAAFPPGIAPVGMSAALFHPVTGYSFPDAVRLALHIADLPSLSGAAIDGAVRSYAADRWNERGFYRLLNKMLFKVAEPHLRWKVLQRFYTLRPSLVARFYAGHSTTYDKMRILTGKPPVPFWKAVNLVMKDL